MWGIAVSILGLRTSRESETCQRGVTRLTRPIKIDLHCAAMSLTAGSKRQPPAVAGVPASRAKLAQLTSRVNEWMDRRRLLLLSTFAILFFFDLVVRAAAMPFWHDEIYTALASRLSWYELWRANQDGFDLMPPLNTALTHVVFLVAGTGEVVTRLPPLLAVVSASLLIHATVRARTNALTAWSATLLFCFTSAARYAYEARSYGLTMFGFALALFAWSEAARGRSRTRNLVLLAVSLALGVWAHYYAVLALLPIVLGEVARYIDTRRLDRGIVLSLATFAVLSLPLYWLISSSMAKAATFWTRLNPPVVSDIYAFVFGMAGGLRFQAAAVIVIATALAARWWSRDSGGPRRTVPAYEVIAGLACLAIPAAGVLVAATVARGVFFERYVLLATAGIAMVIPVIVWRVSPKNGLAELVMFALLLIPFTRMTVQTVEPGRFAFFDPFLARPLLDRELSRGGLVVVTGGVNYFPLWYYAPHDKREWMVYLSDPAAELEQTGTSAIDDGYSAVQRHADANVEDFDGFVATHRQFKLYALEPTWILQRLRAAGAVMHEEATEMNAVIYTVNLPSR